MSCGNNLRSWELSRERKYRFFYHYNRQKNKISIHFRGKCYLVDNLSICVAAVSKRSEKSPKFVVQGWTKGIKIQELENGSIFAYIQ